MCILYTKLVLNDLLNTVTTYCRWLYKILTNSSHLFANVPDDAQELKLRKGVSILYTLKYAYKLFKAKCSAKLYNVLPLDCIKVFFYYIKFFMQTVKFNVFNMKKM